MKKILVVEDNPVNREMLRRCMLRAGYSVILAEDGEQGCQMAQRELPDLIIMDIALPTMDGLEATRVLKADARTEDIPIIVLTAYAENRQQAFDAGCDDYAVKPVAFRVLKQQMQELLDDSTTQSPAEYQVR